MKESIIRVFGSSDREALQIAIQKEIIVQANVGYEPTLISQSTSYNTFCITIIFQNKL